LIGDAFPDAFAVDTLLKHGLLGSFLLQSAIKDMQNGQISNDGLMPAPGNVFDPTGLPDELQVGPIPKTPARVSDASFRVLLSLPGHTGLFRGRRTCFARSVVVGPL
jgi:hypothetical protein